MGFHNGAIATFWKRKDVVEGKSFCDVQISISKKDREKDEYKTEFSSYVRFYGAALKDLDSLQERDRIVLKETDVTRRYDKERDRDYTNFTVYKWERYTGKTDGENHSANDFQGSGYNEHGDEWMPVDINDADFPFK